MKSSKGGVWVFSNAWTSSSLAHGVWLIAHTLLTAWLYLKHTVLCPVPLSSYDVCAGPPAVEWTTTWWSAREESSAIFRGRPKNPPNKTSLSFSLIPHILPPLPLNSSHYVILYGFIAFYALLGMFTGMISQFLVWFQMSIVNLNLVLLWFCMYYTLTDLGMLLARFGTVLQWLYYALLCC